jgi:hypothetical protein
MVAEDSGDLDSALEHYMAIDYKFDIAYFVDVLMTTEQLQAFVENHVSSPKFDQLIYALGVRYLREKDWEKARRAFARVRTVPSSTYDTYWSYSDCNPSWKIKKGCADPKDPEYDFEVPLTTAIIQRDIQTANELESRERRFEIAQDDEAKAEALYQLASYQFEGSKLMFYNPAAWSGERYWNLSELAGKGNYREQNESEQLWKYMEKHETYARALDIYLEVVDKYPNTKPARDALYSAAVCHERLSNYNPYWREVYRLGLHAGSRMVTYADVRANYPDYQLPLGTYGWEPSTRTVNGGPGWAAPPKPAPRPTRIAQVRQLAKEFYSFAKGIWEGTVRRWFHLILMTVGICLLIPRARSARRMLRAQLAQQKIILKTPEPQYAWMTLFNVEHQQITLRDRINVIAAYVGNQLLQLARHEYGRTILVRALWTHSALVTLFVLLVKTYWSG